MIGKYPAKLDDKNRLFVPAKLREELGGVFYVTYGFNGSHKCLTAYTEESPYRELQQALHCTALRCNQPDLYQRCRVQPRQAVPFWFDPKPAKLCRY